MLRSVLRTLRIGKEKYFVGQDLKGNSFYERPAEDAEDWRHAKRTVVYTGRAMPLSEYRFHSLPVQWNSWLRRTRRHPPSLEELQIDVVRQLSVQSNVTRLAIEYKEEKLRGIEPPATPSLAAALRDPQLAAREEQERLNEEDVIRKEEARREAEEAALNPATNVKVEPVVEELPQPVKLGEDRARTQALMRREAEKSLPKASTGNPDSDYQPATWSPAPRSRKD